VTTFDQLKKEVLALSFEQRVLLAESLLDSLPPPTSSDADELAEEQRRNAEIESGQVQPISEAELLQLVEAKRRR
jgi:putative addiction module component